MKTLILSSLSIFAIFLLVSFVSLKTTSNTMKKEELNPSLKSYADKLNTNFETIDETRKKKLSELASYITKEKKASKNVDITVICTHNSRRSHFGQAWLQIAAHYYEINGITTFSGGTEATAFNPRAVSALKRVGLKIEKSEDEKNPVYIASLGEDLPLMKMFSKKYTHEDNPQEDFVAVMVCSDADQNCPIIVGANARFAIPFQDPKVSDDTDQETQTYDERCKQIGTELFFVMSKVKEALAQ